MREAGTALMGIGQARGEDRAVAAAKEAISSPLLEASVDGARGVLLNISGGSDLGLFEVNEAAEVIASAAHQDANIIFGAVIDDALGDEVRVTVIAAGFDRTAEQAAADTGPQAAGSAEDESVWPTPGMRRAAENRVARPAQAPPGQAERREPERSEPERREPERREPERRPRYDGDDDELDIPSFLKR
jgi:cell division protein FtsZ